MVSAASATRFFTFTNEIISLKIIDCGRRLTQTKCYTAIIMILYYT